MQSQGEKLPYSSTEQLLFSNRELPPFLRLLIPNIKTLAEYEKMQKDTEWLNQEVRLSKACYNELNARIKNPKSIV